MAKQKENEKYLSWTQELKSLQEADLDQRQQSRECDRFVLDKDGQWDEGVARQLDNMKRPRMTFDMVTPAMELLMSDIEDMDFSINVKPYSGEATKELSLLIEDMIRGIENDCNATSTYRKACRRIMRRGFDAWIVKSKFRDPWSFEQDLVVEPIKNAINRVWVSGSEEDASDSDYGYVLSALSPEEYKEQFPEGKGISIDDYDMGEQWDEYQPEVVVVAEKYYKKKKKVTVAQLSNGEVIEMDKDDKIIKEELLSKGVTIARTKEVDDFVFYHRVFDGGGFLTDEMETPFNTFPIVTVYGNYELLGESSKPFYHGMVLKQMDFQRVLNYAKSREIEEGALAPRPKIMMTKKQAAGHTDKLAAMNVSADPVQFYNPDPEAPQPYKMESSMPNPGLATLSNDMINGIQASANVNNAMNGNMAGRMSEDAIRMQIDRGTGSTRKWVNAIVNGIRRTGQILLNAIPIVYDTKRKVQLIGIDRTERTEEVNSEIYDDKTQSRIDINNLNQGKYKVFCDAGPAFANKMEAGLQALLQYAAIDPTIPQQGGDIMLKAIDAPLVDKLAERKRMQLVQAGAIPPSQLTEEEAQMLAMQAQQPQPQDPAMMLEQMKIQENILREQNKAQQLEIERYKLMQKDADLQLKAQSQQMDTMSKAADIDNTIADTAKKWAETEKTTGESQAQQIENLKEVTPQVTVITQQ